jgi:hypothetical protein
VLLSFLLPGGGQVYTGNWLKAALIAPAELTLGYVTLRTHQRLMAFLRNDAIIEHQDQEYYRRRGTRDALLWWTGAVIAFSMADAYVSAQMYGFDRETRFTMGRYELRVPDFGFRTSGGGLAARAGIAVGF